ncbi:hypothetical protein O181_029025 [Austropuccinia psidii MF-1]|uniref:non-specific serine/threonine protein kinase n=1 Tax=Austropuccinia psidii MF-1 TaxID=1389203 RepID=A0A9Q3H4T5_9BASI|nr:hypothetical protein [Austropuccinia psidii MF-1]
MQQNQSSNRHTSHHLDSSTSQSSHHRQRNTHQIQTPSSHSNDPNPNNLSMVAPSHPMPRQRIYFGPYLLLQTLGEGEFGKVKLGVHSSPDRWGEEVAIKLIKRGNVDTQARMIKVAREIDVLKLVKHPNIVRLYDVIETEKYIGIVLEYASGGELFDHILAHRYLKEKDASQLFAQLISGVTYLHNKKIVHRDLKLENLLLDRNRNIIITDFGFANRFEDRSNDLMATSCGSPCYAAPELVVQDGRYVGSQVDVWSCGVILYAMLAGYLPFDDDPSNPDGDNINLLYKYIINTPLSFPDWITNEPKDLLLKMLVPDPLKRCSLKDVINHPWLSKYQNLFDRSLDELERLSDENEQQKRLILQRQRQLMAVNHSNQSKLNQSNEVIRSQSTINGKSRGHQSAMVVPSSNLSINEPLIPHHLTGAYHQQQRQTSSGTVTYLHSNAKTPPSGIPIPTNRRNQQAQSAVIVPISSNQNKENVHLPESEPYSSILSQQLNQEKIGLDDETRISLSSTSSGKKRKVVANPSDSSTTTPTTPTALSINPHSHHRHTVQVEYSGHQRQSDLKGKLKTNQDLQINLMDNMIIDQVSLDKNLDMIDNQKTILNSSSLNSNQIQPITPSSHLPSQSKLTSTPQPNRTHQHLLLDPSNSPSDPLQSNLINGLIHSDESKPNQSVIVPFPSPQSTKLNSNHDGPVKKSIINNIINNPSQVSFDKTSQTSGVTNGALKVPLTKSNSRHRKGLSTDRFFSRLLGNNTISPPPHPSPPPLPTGQKTLQPLPSTTSSSTTTKTSRRKALSMVVEPLSGKIASTGIGRQNRKSGRVTNNPSNQTQKVESTKPRNRGTSIISPRPKQNQSSHLSNTQINPTVGLESSSASPPPNNLKITSPTPPLPPNVIISEQESHLQPSRRTPTDQDNNNNNRTEVDSQTSPNWSHRTTATNGAYSTAQSSNTSKAKRVMDWFRFKSLNNSTTSTHLTPPLHTSDNNHNQSGPSITNTPLNDRSKNKVGPPSSSGSTVVVNQQDLGSSTRPMDVTPTINTPQTNSQTQPFLPRKNAPRFTLAHPRPKTSTAATFSVPSLPSTSLLNVQNSNQAFNDNKLRLHHGAIDQNAISSKPPLVIIRQLKQILWEMGIDVIEENSMKLKATRRSKKKVVASLGLEVFQVLQQQQQPHQSHHHQPSHPTGAFKSMFHRKTQAGSNSNHHIGSLIDQFGQVNTGGSSTTSRGGGSIGGESGGSAHGTEYASGAQPLPAYAEDPSIDSGDDVRFTVEVTRLRGLAGLYAVDIKRLKGSLWSFKYLYLQILERSDLGKKA